MERLGTTPLHGGCKLFDLINRPQITLQNLSDEIKAFSEFLNGISVDKAETIEAAEIEMKYHGYIARERALADKMQRLKTSRLAACSTTMKSRNSAPKRVRSFRLSVPKRWRRRAAFRGFAQRHQRAVGDDGALKYYLNQTYPICLTVIRRATKRETGETND